MIKDSYILRYSMAALVISLIVALLFGLAMFSLLTRRIRRLSHAMTSFVSDQNVQKDFTRYTYVGHSGDEIDRLGEHFNSMADRINEQVEELKQNDAKRRELIANVSHDLRTPLTSLHGYIETLLMKEGSLSDEERKQYLKTAANHSQQLKRLINDLFELAKLDSVDTLMTVEPFSLAELAQDIVHSFELPAKQKGVTLSAELDKNVPFAFGDIGMIQRVLDNLIDNALRYTGNGGRISVTLSGEDGHVTVKISDTGCGIPKEDVPHIFDRFYRASKSREDGSFHSGLGLAITKRILALHGSDIQAESEPQVGTTFTFQLSAAQ
jgi:signal transduction histidine kinase